MLTGADRARGGDEADESLFSLRHPLKSPVEFMAGGRHTMPGTVEI